jgi:hypothetical protein
LIFLSSSSFLDVGFLRSESDYRVAIKRQRITNKPKGLEVVNMRWKKSGVWFEMLSSYQKKSSLLSLLGTKPKTKGFASFSFYSLFIA